MTNLEVPTEIIQEIWIPIWNYENLYHVSNLGRVKRIHKTTERILKPFLDAGGYSCVSLSKNDIKKTRKIHKLVAIHFIRRPVSIHPLQTNHKNGIKTDNRVENLEWCTPSYNTQHAYSIGLMKYPARREKRVKNKLKLRSKKSVYEIFNIQNALNMPNDPLKQSSNLLCRTMKPAPVAGFIFSKDNSVSSVSKLYHYRPPVLVKGKHGWYIKYYYRIPVNVRHLYGNKEWHLFRVKEDINRRKGQDKEQYADWLLSEIATSLRNGYNPFFTEVVEAENEAAGIEPKTELNITDALQLFLEKWKVRGLDPLSYSKYERYILRLIDWLKLKHIPYADVTSITQNHIENFLEDMKRVHGFSNREYNNHFDFIRTAFNFLLKKKYISESPCAGFEKQKVKVTKHRFYDSRAMDEITRALKIQDPYTWIVFQTVYYLCVRSDKELMNLKVGNIHWEQSVILAEVSKTDQRYIPMDDNIKLLLKDHIKHAPASHFIFGAHGLPAAEPFSHGLFAKKFRKVRDLIGMSDRYTLYGAKHTRVIDLKQSGATDADIMSLTGHKNFSSYAKYLRDLGMTADIKKLNTLSRKI